MNMKRHVGTCFCHKIPFFIIFGPVLGGSMARYTFSFLPKSKYVSVYITSLLFSHEYTKKFKYEYVGSCFAIKSHFPYQFSLFWGYKWPYIPPSPSKIEKRISQHYRHTISPCFHKTNSSMILQGRVIAIKPHFKPVWGCFGSLLGVYQAQYAFPFLSKLKHTLAHITGQIFFFVYTKKIQV